MENKDLEISIKQFYSDLSKAGEIAKFTEMCRVCLCKTKEESFKLQDTMIFYNERHEVKNMVQESTGIQIVNVDTLPNRICSRCLKSLKSWYKFRSQCQRTDDILKKLSIAEDKKSIPINIQDSSDNDKRKAMEYVLNCDCCNMTFTNQQDLDNHKKTKTKKAEPKNSKTFYCNMCSKSFLFEFGLRNHKELFHYYFKHRPIDVSTCTICGRNFSKLEDLKRHNIWPCVSLKLIEQCKVPPLMVPLEELVETGEKIIETTNISCVFCKKDFQNEFELRPHISTIHHEINRTCNICKKTFKTLRLFEIHIRKHHLRDKNYNCPICSRSFYTIISFRAHIIDHSRRELVYRCNVCQKEYLLEYEFVAHMKTHLLAERNDKKSSEQEEKEQENNALETNNDDESESDIENESNISDEDDSENKSSFKIETDLDTYSIVVQEANQILNDSENSASIKMETDSPIGNKDSKEHIQELKLQDCAMETCVSEEVDSKQINISDNSSVKSEKPESIHTPNEKLNEIFVKTELNLSAEEESQESADDTEDVSATPMDSGQEIVAKIFNECKHTCHIVGCTKEFKILNKALEHFTNKHLSEHAPFECSICLEQFQTKRSILSHIRKYYPFKCPICSKLNKVGAELRKHIYRMHCNFKFECPTCKKKFNGKSDLKAHIITHSKSKDFSCDVCSKSFFSYNGLYLHSKSHMVIKELQCLYCGRQTPSKCRLRRHTAICSKRKELVDKK